MTLEKAIKEHIADRENVLSPSTIAGYWVIQRNRFQSLQKFKLSTIDAAKWQRAVNQEAETISAKTLKNSAMFVQTVIYQATGHRIVARLPQVVPNDLPTRTLSPICLKTSSRQRKSSGSTIFAGELKPPSVT